MAISRARKLLWRVSKGGFQDTPEKPQLEMAKVLQKPVFALPGYQPISVNTLLCDTLGLADQNWGRARASCKNKSVSNRCETL